MARRADHACDRARRADPVCADSGRFRLAPDRRYREGRAVVGELLRCAVRGTRAVPLTAYRVLRTMRGIMARVDVLMPQMGESIAEGTLSKWLKKVGDPVKRDEPLFEISTDKVDAEIPAPAAGVLAEIKVQEGQTVPVQTLVAILETDKGAAAPAPAKPEPPKAAAPAPAPPAPKPEPPAPRSEAPPARPSGRPADGDGGVQTAEQRLRTKSTPLVRKIAAEHSVDISRIPGSGYAGRVTKQDILGYIERAPTVPAPGPSPQPLGPGSITHPVSAAWPGDRVEPWSKIRKITADHMVMS